jgi:hypothetical protein
MTIEETKYLSLARPGQVDPGWIAFWLTSNTALDASCAVWTDSSTPGTETWYLNTMLSSIAQTSALTVKKVGSQSTDYAPPAALVAHAHTITTPSNPGFLTGLNKYFVIKNSGGTVVAVVAQNQSNNPWIEHWWLDQAWVNLASTTGTTITLTATSESTASTNYNSLSGVTYKKHTFAP